MVASWSGRNALLQLAIERKIFFYKPAIHSIAAKLFKRQTLKQNEKNFTAPAIHGNEHDLLLHGARAAL
jgi:hypothetical protein